MKNVATWMIAAAALAVAAGSASAQVMKAEIPFSFQVAGTKMAPGSYTLTMSSGSRVLEVANSDTRTRVLALVNNPVEIRKASQDHGTLTFDCSAGRCALRSLWDGFNTYGYEFRHPKYKDDDEVRVAVIPLNRLKSE